MPGISRRSYQQYCGLAKALDVVGERWTLLLVRELLLGPRRYGELHAALPGITTNLLAKRLKEMRALGLVEKTQLSGAPDVERYRLTESGHALESSVMELARWGGRFMGKPARGDTFNVGWALLSLKRRYRGGRELVASVQVDGREFELELQEQRLQVREKPSERAEVCVVAARDALLAVLFQGQPSSPYQLSGALQVSGDPERYSEFLESFRAP